MKKSNLLFVFLLGLSFAPFAQGIVFEKGNWKQAISKAKASKKLVYIDDYTKWINLSYKSTKKFIPSESLGEFYNNNFVNIRIDTKSEEGKKLAEKYNLANHPTNVFINPNDEKILYKSYGFLDKEGFLRVAKIAIEEMEDPIKLDVYREKFNSNNYDEKFLIKYINKLSKLDINRDEELNTYMNKFSGDKHEDSLVAFLSNNVNSMNNFGFDYLMKNKRYVERFGKGVAGIEKYVESLMQKSIEPAKANFIEASFYVTMMKYRRFLPNNLEKILFYNKEFYITCKNEEPRYQALSNYADYLTNKTAEKYASDDMQGLENVKSQIIAELKSTNTPIEKINELLEQKLNANGSKTYPVSFFAATQLNELAADTWERDKTDTLKLTKALNWAKKAIELSAKSEKSAVWEMQDTYASLLYAIGKKEDAIELETKMMNEAKLLGVKNWESFEKTVNKMKMGGY